MTPKRLFALVGSAALMAAMVGLAAIGAERPANQTLPFGEVNWQKGFIRVSAVGLPSIGAFGSKSAQEMARQNAVNLAQKRLLGVLLDLDARDRRVRDYLAASPNLKERLRDLVSSADVQGKTFSDGSVEITLTLPVEGPQGVKSFLSAL